MSNQDSPNDITEDTPTILTRAQKKKLLEQQKQQQNQTQNQTTPTVTPLNTTPIVPPLNTISNIPNKLIDYEETDLEDDYEDYEIYDEANENYNEQCVEPLDQESLTQLAEYIAYNINKKIQSLQKKDIDNSKQDSNEDSINIENDSFEEEDDEDYDEDDDIDHNGYSKKDGFVVPDDYDSEDDDINNNSSKRNLKQLNEYDDQINKTLKNKNDGYDTDIDEYITEPTIKPILDSQIFSKKPKINYYKLNKEEADTCQEYFDIIKSYKKTTPELYFMNLDIDSKKNIVKKEKNIFKHFNTDTPMRFQILNSNLPDYVKAMAISKINAVDNPIGGYDYKLKEWIDGLVDIPFGKYVNMNVSLFSPAEEIRQFLHNSNRILDKAIYGQQDTKTHVIQIISQLISNPQSIGNVFSIYGPMGTGKTSLVKKGISKVLGRPFTLISLGGMTDSSFFRGHSYTYEGSRPGRIVEILKEAKCMNPIIYFDELDKVSTTSKGEEIIHTLIHLTDKSQNMNFQDSYYSGVPIDLSKIIFIFSYNDENLINPILRDRMHKISVNGFSVSEKVTISNQYLLKDIFNSFNFSQTAITFPTDIIKYIINNYTKNDFGEVEQGVRNLERCLETIVSKLNVLRLYHQNTEMINSYKDFPKNAGINNNKQIIEQVDSINVDVDDEDLSLEVEKPEPIHMISFDIPNLDFPIVITNDIVDKFLNSKPINISHMTMYS
jgi:ATP-dependent Lon protease